MKPRLPGGPHAALVRTSQQVAAAQGQPEEMGPQLVAEFLGRSVGMVYKQLDPDQPEEMSFARVAQLVRAFGASAAAEFLAVEAGGVFMPLPDYRDRREVSEHLATAVEKMGASAAALVRDLMPNSEGGSELVSSEARSLLPRFDDLLAEVAWIRAFLAKRAEGDK